MSRPLPASAAKAPDPRHVRGLEGEEAAIAHLRALGWVLESHRFRFGRHDLDLVMRSGDLVAFIEVKTRSSPSTRFGAAAEAVGWRKRRILDQGAAWWRRQHGRPGDRYRFDVVEVYEAQGGFRVEHIPDAWRG